MKITESAIGKFATESLEKQSYIYIHAFDTKLYGGKWS